MKKYLEKKINKLIKETYDKEIELLKRELILNMKLNEEEKKRREYYESIMIQLCGRLLRNT